MTKNATGKRKNSREEKILRIDDEHDQLDELERDINSGWTDENMFSGVGSGKKQFNLGPLPNTNIPRLNTSICNSIENLE